MKRVQLLRAGTGSRCLFYGLRGVCGKIVLA